MKPPAIPSDIKSARLGRWRPRQSEQRAPARIELDDGEAPEWNEFHRCATIVCIRLLRGPPGRAATWRPGHSQPRLRVVLLLSASRGLQFGCFPAPSLRLKTIFLKTMSSGADRSTGSFRERRIPGN